MSDYDDSDFGDRSRPSSDPRWFWVALLVVAFLLLGLRALREPRKDAGGGTTFVGGQAAPGADSGAPRSITPRGDLDDDEIETIQLFQKCSKSVVFITTIVRGLNRLTMNPVEIPRGTGTGFIWDKNGHVVTNYHVVEGSESASQQIKVVLADQSTWSAELIGRAQNRDIAVLKLEAPPEKLAELQPIAVGTSDDLIVGQSVYAIGNPFGFDQTLTTGIISGLERTIQGRSGQRIEGLIQTDAAINPGNSGGPLLDSSGRLIGVNTAIYSPSGAYAGIGFAIPVDNVNRLVPRLIYRKVDGPAFGIALWSGETSRQLGILGVIVRSVTTGGTADLAGVKPTVISPDGDADLGDIIVGVDEMRIKSKEDLFDFLDAHQIGDDVTITVLRDFGTRRQRTLELKATLQRQSFD